MTLIFRVFLPPFGKMGCNGNGFEENMAGQSDIQLFWKPAFYSLIYYSPSQIFVVVAFRNKNLRIQHQREIKFIYRWSQLKLVHLAVVESYGKAYFDWIFNCNFLEYIKVHKKICLVIVYPSKSINFQECKSKPKLRRGIKIGLCR